MPHPGHHADFLGSLWYTLVHAIARTWCSFIVTYFLYLQSLPQGSWRSWLRGEPGNFSGQADLRASNIDKGQHSSS